MTYYDTLQQNLGHNPQFGPQQQWGWGALGSQGGFGGGLGLGQAAYGQQYGQYGDDFRAVLESYAEGLNLYAALHPSEADARLLPLQGKDIAAGFAHKIPIMLGLPRALTSVALFR